MVYPYVPPTLFDLAPCSKMPQLSVFLSKFAANEYRPKGGVAVHHILYRFEVPGLKGEVVITQLHLPTALVPVAVAVDPRPRNYICAVDGSDFVNTPIVFYKNLGNSADDRFS